jgi:DNA polymerase III alpha subunit
MHVAYQTAYLKANYPAEYIMVLSNNMSDIKQVSFFYGGMQAEWDLSIRTRCK